MEFEQLISERYSVRNFKTDCLFGQSVIYMVLFADRI